MNKALKYLLVVVVILLALYGGWRLASDALDASHGKEAEEVLHPFVRGAASSARRQFKQDLANVPAERLEKEGEELGRKLYPFTKGFVKGQLDAFRADPNKAEFQQRFREAGKDISKDIVAPLSEGVAESSRTLFESLGKALEGVKKFKEDNKDVFDGISSGMESLQKKMKESPMPPPPLSPDR